VQFSSDYPGQGTVLLAGDSATGYFLFGSKIKNFGGIYGYLFLFCGIWRAAGWWFVICIYIYICAGARVEYETAGLGHNEGDKPAGWNWK